MLAQYSIQFVSDEGLESTVGVTYGDTLSDVVERLIRWYGDKIVDLRIQPLEEVIDDFEDKKLREFLVFDHE